MKIKRLLTALFVSILSMGVMTGCTEEEISQAVLPNYQKEDLNITSITIENIPEEIQIGYFDSYEMYFKVVYSDESVEQFPLRMINLPESMKQKLVEVGTYTFSIYFRGKELTYTFNVVPGVEEFVVTYYSYDGHVIQVEHITPGDHAKQPAPSGPERAMDPLYVYEFKEWDRIVTPETTIYEDLNIYPLYTKTKKRYSSKPLVPTSNGGIFRLLKRNETAGKYEAYFHVGRIERTPLLFSGSYPISTYPSFHISLGYGHFEDDDDLRYQIDATTRRVYLNAFDVDTSDWTTYFTFGEGLSVETPKIYLYDDFDVTQALDSTLTLFEGETSYSELHRENMSAFVSYYDVTNHTEEFDITVPSDIDSTMAYYRGAIEVSVDFLLHVQFELNDNKLNFSQFEYIPLIDMSTIYHDAEFSINHDYNPVGEKVVFDMEELNDEIRRAI